jgi:hypothetical protein
VTFRSKTMAVLLLLIPAFAAFGHGQSGSMSTFAGLNTVQNHLNASAAPDVEIAVGLTEYCEHVNSAYQCWYKSGVNANQPVKFLGSTIPKSDSGAWSQNGNNGGATPHCPTAYTPNSQLIHDNVYNLWIMEKRITSSATGHNYMCVAISNVEDISLSNFAWFAFEFDLDTVIPTNSKGNFYYPDYPQVGLWQSSISPNPPYSPATDQAMWITYDLQDMNNAANVNAVLVCALDLAGMRASTASPYVNNSKTPACTVAHPLTTYNPRRSWVPANNSDTVPPVSGDGEMFTYMISPPKDGKTYLTDPNHTQGVEQWTINWSAANPVPTFVNSWDMPSTRAGGDQLGCFTPASFYNTVCVPQPSTSSTGIHIDSVADRMQQMFQYTSNNGWGSVWTSVHAVQISPSSTALTQTEADVRILQRNASSPNAVYLAADYPFTDPTDSSAFVFLPSVVRDKSGNLQGILATSGSGVNQHPALDSWFFNPATLQSETYGYIESPVTDGDAQDTDTLNYRWGDWQSAVLDPSDSCTVWVAGEYLPSNRTTEPYWYTQMASLPPIGTCAGGPVLLSNVSMNFGTQQVDVKSSGIVETITNNQSATLNISGISIGGGEFTQTNTCQQPVAAHGTCTVTVSLTAAGAGARSATLTITDDAAGSPQLVALAGTGASSSVSVTPSSIAFGNETLNVPTAGQGITLSNTGISSVTVNTVQASGGYTETDNCTGAILSSGQSCTITAAFDPVVPGMNSGAITINDNTAGSPHIVTLTGTGQLAVSLSANLTFPATNVGSTSPTQTLTMTNNQNTTLSFTWVTSGDYTAVGNGTSPCNGTLAAKAKCTFGVTFTPGFNGQIKGAITITHNALGSPSSAGFTGTGQNGTTPALSFTPATLGYGNVVLNTTSSKTVTIKNIGSASITINSVTGSGPFVATPSGTTPCGGVLNASKSCTVTVAFTPLVTGTTAGAVTVSNTSSIGSAIQNASGNGILPVTVFPTSIAFGTVSVGSTSAVQVVTVTNNMSTATPVSSIIASGDFIYTTGGNIPCGASLPANGICTLGVQFSPSAAGAISGDLTLSDTAGYSPEVVSLTGTGQ